MSYSKTVSFTELGLDRRTINGTLKGASNTTMLSLIGNPRGTYDQDCRWPTNNSILAQVVTDNVGPFRVSGLKPAVETLAVILADVKAEKPEIYDVMGNVGMLCCRYVRGSTSSISNHSWGTAIDLTLEGKLDKRGDSRTQKGLLEIYPIFNRHKFFWGAAFSTEDAMHFEASDQLIKEWANDGRITVTGAGATSALVQFGDRGPDVEELQKRLNHLLGLDLDTDGIFGPATRAAVMEFQRVSDIEVNGVVDKKTKKALDA